MNTTSKSNKPWIIEYLPKLGNYLLGISIICYILGFVITNLYLGSLGIVNLEILRSRYILSGFLFLVFLAAIAYLTYGLIKTLQKYQVKPPINIILRVLLHSVDNFLILFFAIAAFMVLAGSRINPPIGISQLSPIIPWGDWFTTIPASTLTHTFELLGLLISCFILLLVIIIIINPKNQGNTRRPRKELLGKIFKNIWKDKFKIIGGLLSAFILIYLLLLMNSALTFLSTNKVVDMLEPIKISPSTSSATSSAVVGWSRFFLLIVIIYIIIAVLLTSVFFNAASTSSSDDKPVIDNPLSISHGLILVIAIAILLIVPAYTLGVYPNIPQQVGGGQIIRVDAQISNNDASQLFLEPNTNTYLIDRTSCSSIFLLIDNVSNEYKVQEIQNDLIFSITYNP